MRILIFCISFFIIYPALSQQLSLNKSHISGKDARTVLFDGGWQFKNASFNEKENDVSDKGWKEVILPHDWSVEDIQVQSSDIVIGPFTRTSAGGTATGFVQGGTGWYRKFFTTIESDLHKKVLLTFDGVYMDADVWLNGHMLGSHHYGYTPFSFELQRWLNPPGKENELKVRVQNTGKNSRWYSGSGIYRHVWITKTGPVHMPFHGVYITTPSVNKEKAEIRCIPTVINETRKSRNIKITTYIFTPDGKKAGSAATSMLLREGDSVQVNQVIIVRNPLLWSPEAPQLYKAVVCITEADQKLDSIKTEFGIRILHVDAVNGLTLNGNKIKLRGGCIHHDYGPLGAAAIDRAEERKIEILKNNGFNAVRLSHNPPSQQFLDFCDRLGMLVIDEAFDMWERPKNPEDYHLYFKDWWKKDLDAMILRDRNHPSVIMWSIGNEINERADTSGLLIAEQLIREIRRLDSSRFITEAICSFWDHPGRKWEATAPAFSLLDIGGYNYKWDEYESDHQKYPERIMAGTESVPKEALQNWNMVEKHPYVIGDFVWTAMDYMGETAIGHSLLSNQKDSFSLGWPWFDAYCGDIDLAGQKKPQSYYRDVVWKRKNIAMAVHRPLPEGLTETISYWGWPDEEQSWNWKGFEGKIMTVRVFSRYKKVRLKLNHQIIGEQNVPDSSLTAVFMVPYQPGSLKAIGMNMGKEEDSVGFETADEPYKLRMFADRKRIESDPNDLSYITVEVVDMQNRLVPDAELPVRFSISGSGELAGVISGNPKDMSSFQQPLRKTFRGRCLLIVRPKGNKGGNINIKAECESLKQAQVKVVVRENQ